MLFDPNLILRPADALRSMLAPYAAQAYATVRPLLTLFDRAYAGASPLAIAATVLGLTAALALLSVFIQSRHTAPKARLASRRGLK